MTDVDATPDPAPSRGKTGPEPTLKGGRSRTPWVEKSLWKAVPSPKSPWVRAALAEYLLDPEDIETRPRDESGRYLTGETAGDGGYVGVYVEDAQWEALGRLPGTITAHFTAALRRRLGQR